MKRCVNTQYGNEIGNDVMRLWLCCQNKASPAYLRFDSFDMEQFQATVNIIYNYGGLADGNPIPGDYWVVM